MVCFLFCHRGHFARDIKQRNRHAAFAITLSLTTNNKKHPGGRFPQRDKEYVGTTGA